ncbi:histidine kinase [Chloroflexota bacterium]
MSDNRILDLEKEIAELKNRMPAHSVPNHMMQRLIELEDELEQLKKEG